MSLVSECKKVKKVKKIKKIKKGLREWDEERGKKSQELFQDLIGIQSKPSIHRTSQSSSQLHSHHLLSGWNRVLNCSSSPILMPSLDDLTRSKIHDRVNFISQVAQTSSPLSLSTSSPGPNTIQRHISRPHLHSTHLARLPSSSLSACQPVTLAPISSSQPSPSTALVLPGSMIDTIADVFEYLTCTVSHHHTRTPRALFHDRLEPLCSPHS